MNARKFIRKIYGRLRMKFEDMWCEIGKIECCAGRNEVEGGRGLSGRISGRNG